MKGETITVAELNISFGKADITPDEPVFLMGYADRDKKSREIFSHIYVSALKLSQPDKCSPPIFIIAFDLGWFLKEAVESLRKALSEHFSINTQQFFIACSHTHYAPSVNNDHWIPLNPGYLEFVIEKTIDAIQQCQDSEPTSVSLWYGSGKTDLGINRRRLNKWIRKMELRPNPKGVYDDKVQVIGLKTQQKNWHSVVFKVSCHPVGTPSKDYLIHGSWPGEAIKLLTSQYQNLVNFNFLNGTAGDVRPRNLAHRGRFRKGSPDLEMMDQATQIADEISEILQSRMKLVENVDLKIELGEIPLSTPQLYSNTELLDLSKKRDHIRKGEWASRLVDNYISKNLPIPQSVAFPCHLIEITPTFRIVGLGGEICTGIGTIIETSIPGNTVVVGYCNNTIGYIPTSAIIHEDVTLKLAGYEGYGSIFLYDLPSPFSEAIDEEIKEGVSSLIRKF